MDTTNKIIRPALTLGEYQQKAMTTCMPSCENFSYMLLNLVGEIGEFASKVAKDIRKGNVSLESGQLVRYNDLDEACEAHEALKKEAGDILWQLSGLCYIMGWGLQDVAYTNLDKLAARKAAGTIDGSGDGTSREERL